MPGKRGSDRSATHLLIAALLLAGLPLAGCIGSDGDGGSTTVQPSSTSTTGALAFDDGTAAFVGTLDRKVLWSNGSFAARENQIAGQADGSWVHSVDVTDKIPENNLVRLNATLDFEEDPTEQVWDNLEVELSAPDQAVIQSRNTDRTIPQYLTAALLSQGQGPIEVLVGHQWPKASTETAYTLRIEIATAATTVPAGVPTAVDVPEDAATIEVRPDRPDAAMSTLAWGSDNGFLGWQSTEDTSTLSYPSPSTGTYIVRPDANAHLRLVDATGQPVQPGDPLEPLRVNTTLGEGHTLPVGSGPETWTTNVSKAPIGVSFQVLPTGLQDSGVLAGEDIRVKISTENGTVMDEPFFLPANPFAAGAPPLGDGLTGFPRTFAHSNTTDGEWTWTAEYDLAAEVEVVPVWIHHERSG